MAKAVDKSKSTRSAIPTEIPLRDYFYLMAYPQGRPSIPPSIPEPPDDPGQFAEWDKNWKATQAHQSAAEEKAWREICEQAFNKKISIVALCIENPDFDTEVLDEGNAARGRWYPNYYRNYNVRKMIPPDFFTGDVAFGPAEPSVIYYTKGGPFYAPWADPRVILKPRAAKAHNRSLCVQWLISLRRNGPQKAIKDIYAVEAFNRFGVTSGQFQGVWDDAAKEAPSDQWGNAGSPGKESSKTIE